MPTNARDFPTLGSLTGGEKIFLSDGLTINAGNNVLSNTLKTFVLTGAVTSVGLSLPSIFSVSGSPVTTTGTLTGSLASQSAHTVFSGPVGVPGTPTFRALVSNDIPSLDASKITTGFFSTTQGGLGITTTPTNGQIPIGNGANYIASVLTAGSTKLSIANGSGSITLDVVPANISINTLGGTPLTVGNGGLGISTTPTNGQIPIGNGTNYVAANLTAGDRMTVTNGAASISISSAYTPGHLNGMGASFNTTAIIDIAVGSARDSTDTFNITLSSAKSISLDISGIGGLDTGVKAANSWYAFYIIADSTNVNPPQGIVSLNFSAPAYPGGYDRSRRVAVGRTDAGSNLLNFKQNGSGRTRKYFWDDVVAAFTVLTLGNATTFTALSLAASMPPSSFTATLICIFEVNGGAGGDSFYFRATGSAVSIANTVNRNSNAGANAFFLRRQVDVITNSSQSIDYAVENAADSLTVVVMAFEDNL